MGSITYKLEVVEWLKNPTGSEIGVRELIHSTDLTEILRLSRMMPNKYGNEVGNYRIKDSNNVYLTPKQYKDFICSI